MNARRTFWTFPRFSLHIQWLSESIGIARLFLPPIGAIDAETGQPWGKWSWGCVIILRDGTLTFCAALTGPPAGCLAGLKAAAREIGATVAVWERWEAGRKRETRIKL